MTPIGRIQMVRNAIGNLRIDVSDERTLQNAVYSRLQRDGLLFRREYALSPFDRIDFLVLLRQKDRRIRQEHAGNNDVRGIGVEVKVDGTCPQLTRQVHRYLEYDALEGLVVVTNRARLTNLPKELRHKPVAVHLLTGAMI